MLLYAVAQVLELQLNINGNDFKIKLENQQRTHVTEVARDFCFRNAETLGVNVDVIEEGCVTAITNRLLTDMISNGLTIYDDKVLAKDAMVKVSG